MKRRDFVLANAVGLIAPGMGWAAQPCPPPQVSVSGGTTATTDCAIVTGRSYSTSFDATENPISEGGAWSHTAANWQVVQTTGGRAHASAYTDSYDDAYAVLSGFPPNVQAEATIYKGAAVSYEVELLLRVAQTANTVRGYECLFNVAGSVQLMRWNGPRGSFTPFGRVYSSPIGVTGDKIRARIYGNLVQFWHIPIKTGTPVLIAEGTDSTYADGQPGISFYVHAPVNRSDVGLADYSVVSI